MQPYTICVTHLRVQGVDWRSVQKLLGQASSKTTEIYTRIRKKGMGALKSLLDFWDMQNAGRIFVFALQELTNDRAFKLSDRFIRGYYCAGIGVLAMRVAVVMPN